MRVPADRPRARGRIPTNRIWLIVAAVVLLFLITSLRGIAGFYTDYLWFEGLGFSSVFRGTLGAKALLVVVFVGVFFAAMYTSLTIAERLAPRFRPLGSEDEIVQRYREVLGPHTGKVRLAVSIVFALIAGGGVSSQWASFVLFRNHVSFGVEDAQFHRDIGFYVFQLPFLRFVVDWLFVAIVIITFVTVVAHYLNGGIRLPRSPMERVTPQVKAHVSVLLALLALVKAASYYLDRYDLATSHRGVVDGPTYTDIHAQLPAINLLMFVMLIAFVLFLANIRLQGWLLPGIAVGLWLFLSVVVGGIVPAVVQRVRVEPAENDRERPYIRRNIAATREAMGIRDVERVPFDYQENLDAAALQQNADTIRNLRLWDPAYTHATFSQDQKLRSYYQLSDLDIDRYNIDGQLTQVLLAARDLDPDGFTSNIGSWVNRRLQYTHGIGAVMAPANAVVDGKPNFVLSEVPPQGQPELKEPRIYFGEQLGGFAVVNSKQRELDYQQREGERSVYTRYTGKGGVAAGSVIRRAAFALRFGDTNMLLSNQITARSRVVYVRDIADRVRKAAPFLHYDSDPYPIITGSGRLVWLQDAYTTTSKYPYAQRASAGTDRLSGGHGLKHSFNYVRNSVKVVTDAYDGTMTFYRVDMEDPIAAAYAKAFPKLFVNGDRMPEELRPHLRYPEELFRVQTAMFGRYHITDPSEFFLAGDAWHVAQDARSGALRTTDSTVAPGTATAALRPVAEGSQERMDPYYLLARMPNEPNVNFQIIQPFVPASRNNSQRNLTAFMVAKMDPGVYGKLQVFEMPRDRQVDGPALVDNDINSDAVVAPTISLLGQRGSTVIFGNLLVIPIENSLLWMRPLYVQAQGAQVPELRHVIVSYGGRVSMRDTLQDALRDIFGNAPATLEQPGEGGQQPTGPAPTASVRELLDRALAAYDQAQQALRNGDLSGYQRKIEEFSTLTRQARDEAAKASSPTPTTAPSRSA